jgi:hypothetical protein
VVRILTLDMDDIIQQDFLSRICTTVGVEAVEEAGSTVMQGEQGKRLACWLLPVLVRLLRGSAVSA